MGQLSFGRPPRFRLEVSARPRPGGRCHVQRRVLVCLPRSQTHMGRVHWCTDSGLSHSRLPSTEDKRVCEDRSLRTNSPDIHQRRSTESCQQRLARPVRQELVPKHDMLGALQRYRHFERIDAVNNLGRLYCGGYNVSSGIAVLWSPDDGVRRCTTRSIEAMIPAAPCRGPSSPITGAVLSC